MKKSKLIIDCDSKDKARWVLAAKASDSKNLGTWVNATLNSAMGHMQLPPPKWMSYFPEGLSQCLLRAGITQKLELVDCLNNSRWDWEQVNGFSSDYLDVLSQWRDMQG
jgi:hypothetical protein